MKYKKADDVSPHHPLKRSFYFLLYSIITNLLYTYEVFYCLHLPHIPHIS